METKTNNQLNMFESNRLRDKGMKQAVDHADSVTDNWSDRAYDFLILYSQNHKEFLAEDVRLASYGIVPEPPHKRAWGAIMVKAKKNGVIIREGFEGVKNPAAHRAICTLWRVAS